MSDLDFAIDQETLRKEIEFLQKRYDNTNKGREILKSENKVLRQELNSMKEFVQKLVIPSKTVTSGQASGSIKDDMHAIIDFQSKKIDSLETELASLRSKYENAIQSKQEEHSKKTASLVQAEQEIDRNKIALVDANRSVKQLQKQMTELKNNSAKEIAGLKQKLAENNAELILAVRENSKLSSNHNGLGPRKPLTQQNQSLNEITSHKKRLGPIHSVQDLNSKKINLEATGRTQTLFHYRNINE